MFARSPVRLLVFGDSWARCDEPGMTPWPELLGRSMRWNTINVAVPGSTSDEVLLQLESVKAYMKSTGTTLHPDAWAIIHAGGNDLLEEVINNAVSFALEAVSHSVLCCSSRCCEIKLLQKVASNMEEIAYHLHRDFGVHNIAFVSLPLTVAIPAVDGLVEALKKDLPYLAPVAPFVMRRLNATHESLLARHLRHFSATCSPEEGLQTIVLDEAAALESIQTSMSQSNAPALFLEDGLHLTQVGHDLLVKEFLDQMQDSLEDEEEEASPGSYGCVRLDDSQESGYDQVMTPNHPRMMHSM
eukprot:TRINITY_DN76348_c0_g1_i1.p1 TRINITY_DN76348_c0_g1~~TRINITY_DN76348_c0_g1_i1.p1  ORF type:complete len:300 (+),score=35.10 TRINITY_DN76348_c0_g1_i1:85-984(+)